MGAEWISPFAGKTAILTPSFAVAGSPALAWDLRVNEGRTAFHARRLLSVSMEFFHLKKRRRSLEQKLTERTEGWYDCPFPPLPPAGSRDAAFRQVRLTIVSFGEGDSRARVVSCAR